MSASQGSNSTDHDDAVRTQNEHDGTSRQTDQAATHGDASSARGIDDKSRANDESGELSTPLDATALRDQSQTTADQDVEEIPSDMTDTLAQMLEIRNKDPTLFERMMRAVQSQSSPVPASSPGPSASRTSRTASSVAGAREASPAQQTFLHVGIKAGSSASKKVERNEKTAAEKSTEKSPVKLVEENQDGDKSPEPGHDMAVEEQATRSPKQKQAAQPQLQPPSQPQKESQASPSQNKSDVTSAIQGTTRKPAKRPFFSEARRLGLSRTTSHYLSTKAANAGKDFSPELCYSIMSPDAEGFEDLCERIEKTGLFLDRHEYAKVLVAALQTRQQPKPASARPSESPHQQGHARSQIQQSDSERASRRSSSTIDLPHGLPIATSAPLHHQPTPPQFSPGFFPPAMQAPWLGTSSPHPPGPYGYPMSGPPPSMPGSQPGTHTVYPFGPQPTPYTPPPSFPHPPQYTGQPQLTGPGPIPAYISPRSSQNDAPRTRQGPNGQPSNNQRFNPPSQQLLVSSPPFPTTAHQSGSGAPIGVGIPNPLPYGALGPGVPPQPQPRRETPQGQPQFLQHNAAIQGRNLGHEVSQPAQIQSNIGESNRAMTAHGQAIQVPYYPLPPQLGGVPNGAMPTAVTAGVKRPLPTTHSTNGTIVPIPHAKKPRLNQGSIPSPRPREIPVSQIPHRPAPQPGSYAAVPTASQPTNHAMSTRGVKSRTDLISPIDREKALANTTYKTATIARDILISAGRHPTERPLNEHLKKLLDFKCVDYEMDLASFRWDLVDPIGETPASTTTNKPSAATQVEKKATGGDGNQEKKKEEEEAESTNAEKPKETEPSQKQGASAKLLADFLSSAKKGPGDGESSKPAASLTAASKQ